MHRYNKFMRKNLPFASRATVWCWPMLIIAQFLVFSNEFTISGVNLFCISEIPASQNSVLSCYRNLCITLFVLKTVVIQFIRIKRWCKIAPTSLLTYLLTTRFMLHLCSTVDVNCSRLSTTAIKNVIDSTPS